MGWLGWREWFEQRAECAPRETIARVAAIDREQLVLMDHDGFFRAKLAGSYLHRHCQPHELPCVGDWVRLEKRENGPSLVKAILERQTSLRRKTAGNAIDYQMIAANVDCVIIVQSCPVDFNINRLTRYLIMAAEGGIEAHILLTKTDLVEPDILAEQVSNIRAAGITAPVFAVSTVTRDGVESFASQLANEKTYCFVGSSGVGKSSLINLLLGNEVLSTQDVSDTGEGRHTTVRREMIRLLSGALVIDTPGMRELGVVGADSGIGASQANIEALAADCRYRNCSHTCEPGCAVRAAVETGALSSAQYENYVKLKSESDFNQMSYVEKRRRDRSFSRSIKSAKKTMRDS